MTKVVKVGPLQLGGGNPVLVQSMTNTDTRDAEATLAQIRALADAGCDIVRVSVYDEACAEAVKKLAAESPVPLCPVPKASNSDSSLRGKPEMPSFFRRVEKSSPLPVRILWT